MKLVVVRKTNPYGPEEFVTGELVAPKEPHNSSVMVRDERGRIHYGVPVGELFTSDEEENDTD